MAIGRIILLELSSTADGHTSADCDAWNNNDGICAEWARLRTASKPSLFSRGNLSTAADSIQDRQHGHPLGAVLDWQREEIARCVTSTVGV